MQDSLYDAPCCTRLKFCAAMACCSGLGHFTRDVVMFICLLTKLDNQLTQGNTSPPPSHERAQVGSLRKNMYRDNTKYLQALPAVFSWLKRQCSKQYVIMRLLPLDKISPSRMSVESVLRTEELLNTNPIIVDGIIQRQDE